jgi:hypothetical protein
MESGRMCVLAWVVALWSGVGVSGVEGAAGPRMTDAELFAALDLDGGGLAAVKAATEAEDWAGARAALAGYMRSRERPRWFFDGRKRPAPATQPNRKLVAEADRYARNELVSVGVWHAFGEDIDWTANPTANHYLEWTWQLSRHHFWRTLGRAYGETGDEEYARAFVRQMRDWVHDNPVPRNKADQGPGSRWRTIEAGIRVSQSWPEAFYRFLTSPSFTDDDLCLMVKSFAEHARYLREFPTRGNWLMMEADGLYHVGALFPEFREAAAWRRVAMQRLYDELVNQVYPDGAQYELSTNYHLVTLDNARWALELARLNDYAVPADYVDRMEGMYTFNLYMARPDWRLPDLNDGYEHDVRPSMRDAVRYFPKREDFRWVATGGREGRRPAQTSYAFEYAGFLVMRSGWDPRARWGLLEVGPFGAAHQHEDKLNLLLYAYGRPLLIEAGNYAYDTSQWRRYVLSSYAHNVILIDGLGQHRRGGDRREYVVRESLPHKWRSTESFDYAAGTYGNVACERYGKGNVLPARWSRHVLFVKDGASNPDARRGYWLVVDGLEPTDDATHVYEAMFHLDGDAAKMDASTGRVDTTKDGAANLAIVPADGIPVQVRVVKGQETPHVQRWVRDGGLSDYRMRAVPTAIYRQERAGPTAFIYVFYPTPAGADAADIRVEAVRIDPRGTSTVRVTIDGAVDTLSVGVKPGLVRER